MRMTKEIFTNLCEGLAYLYIIKCSDEEEVFYKIGVTSREDPYKRFSQIPYETELLRFYSHPSPNLIMDLERQLLSICKGYKPLKEFGGQSECIVYPNPAIEFIETLSWIRDLERLDVSEPKKTKTNFAEIVKQYYRYRKELCDHEQGLSLLSEEKLKMLRDKLTEFETDSDYSLVVDYVNLFGHDSNILELSYGSLRPQVLKDKITKHHDLQLLKDVFKSKYKKGDILTNEDLKQEFKRVSEVYSLTTKFKISDMSSILNFTSTCVRDNGKKYNAIKIS